MATPSIRKLEQLTRLSAGGSGRGRASCATATSLVRSGEQVWMVGPSVRLQPKTAETLGLAVHERAANAVKYGALSLPHGRIPISWRVHNGTEVPRLVPE